MTNHLSAVRKAAESMNLADGTGKLQMDSLTLIDFVVALETATKLRIPTASLRAENFESIDSVARMLQELSDAAGS